MSQNTPAWANLSILQRVLKYDWSKELIIAGSVLLFVGLHFWGSNANKKTVESWIDTHKEVLESEFFQVGISKDSSVKMVVNSPTNYVTYATGRQNIDSFSGIFKLKGRQNLISLSIEYILGFFFSLAMPSDAVEITITPNKNAPINNFVFAIVNKEIMKRAREGNYSLSLTKTTDSAKLPVYLVFMSENPEVTDAFFTPELAEAVQTSQNILDSLIFSDQGKNRPENLKDVEPATTLNLVLKFPKSEEDKKTSIALLSAVIRLVDVAAEKTLRPEVIKKIKATRETELKKIQKAKEEEKAEELAEKKANEKREQRNRISKLSPAEQKKIEEKERKKEQRKMAQKQTRRG